MDGFILSIPRKPLVEPLYSVLDVEKPSLYHIPLPKSLMFPFHWKLFIDPNSNRIYCLKSFPYRMEPFSNGFYAYFITL